MVLKVKIMKTKSKITKKVKVSSILLIFGTFIFASLPVQAATGSTLENGGFETGSLSPWTTDYASVQSGSYYIHSGSKGLALVRYISSTYYAAYIQQDVSILVDNLKATALTFYMKSNQEPIKVTITYEGSAPDDVFTFTDSSSWVQRSITKSSLDAGETIDKIKFERIGTSLTTTAVDDILLHNTIENGGFETGSLSPWTTDYASVQSGSYYIHSGSKGLALVRYISSTYYAAYIQQDVSISVDDLSATALTFYMKSHGSAVKVTITYEGSAPDDVFTFSGSISWVQRSIAKSSLDAGETIDKIKFERIGSPTVSTTAIDDIIVHD